MTDERDDPYWEAESAKRDTLFMVVKLVRWYAEGAKITGGHDWVAKAATCEEIAKMIEERFALKAGAK